MTQINTDFFRKFSARPPRAQGHVEALAFSFVEEDGRRFWAAPRVGWSAVGVVALLAVKRAPTPPFLDLFESK